MEGGQGIKYLSYTMLPAYGMNPPPGGHPTDSYHKFWKRQVTETGWPPLWPSLSSGGMAGLGLDVLGS